MPSIASKMLDYIANFNFYYVNDVSCYERLLKIGQGTFGEVFKARCKRTGRLVALKKILMENEKEGFPITALREIKMLQKLRHPNITELIDIVSEKNSKQRFSFYLVFTFCDHDLAGLLSHNSLKLRLVEIKTMIKHILNGLYKIHNSNILHRDMKAANVLITQEGVLKLADFGLARPMFNNTNACYTNRVVTLWYRPPELLLGARNYGSAIDIWGAGCIMAELWTRTPILQGDSEAQQLKFISCLCGSINPKTWPDVDKLPYYNKMELPQDFPRVLRDKVRRYLHNNESALSVLDLMLTLNPAQRPSAEQLLDHYFFYESPRPLDNIKDLLSQLKTNMFEYTAGCGAHANRNRNNQQQQQQAVQSTMQHQMNRSSGIFSQQSMHQNHSQQPSHHQQSSQHHNSQRSRHNHHSNHHRSSVQHNNTSTISSNTISHSGLHRSGVPYYRNNVHPYQRPTMPHQRDNNQR